LYGEIIVPLLRINSYAYQVMRITIK
jgi:hypothetical protein